MRSGFFNSNIIDYDDYGNPIYDRAEEAEFFSKYFSCFVGNGVFPNPSTGLQAIANSKMGVTIKPGCCFINGRFGWVDEESGEELTVDHSDTILARIDRVVARLDIQERVIQLAVKKGNPGANPSAPTLERSLDVYELGIADIRVNPNVNIITQGDITDLRLNSNYCGIVTGVVQQVDTTTIFNQYQAFLNNLISNNENKYQDWFNNFTTPSEEQFKKWFDTIKGLLDGDVAGKLFNYIDSKTKITTATVITTKTGIKENTDYTIPVYYIPGSNNLEVYYMGEKLIKDTHYIEVTQRGEESNIIQFKDWEQDVPAGRTIEFVVRGELANA